MKPTIKAFLFGFLGGVLVMLWPLGHVLNQWNANTQQWQQLTTEGQAALRACIARQEGFTVVFEPAPADGRVVFAQAMLKFAGVSLELPASRANSRASWVIPGRVQPVPTDPTGTFYYWVNTETRTVEGPFDSAVLR